MKHVPNPQLDAKDADLGAAYPLFPQLSHQPLLTPSLSHMKSMTCLHACMHDLAGKDIVLDDNIIIHVQGRGTGNKCSLLFFGGFKILIIIIIMCDMKFGSPHFEFC